MSSRRLISTQTPRVVLLRDFIRASLYDPSHGYFCQNNAPIGSLEEPIEFDALEGKDEYYDAVAQQYDTLGTHWLTPAEIFSPHIGHSIASYISDRIDEKKRQGWGGPLTIYEIGGGTGTLAKDALDWLRAHRNDVYSSCRYETIDISLNLADRQRDKVHGAGHGDDVFRAHVGDACEHETWHRVARDDTAGCFIVGMEVLDNLPHDKVVKLENDLGESVWMESCVEYDPENLDQEPEEHVRPLSDAVITDVLKSWSELKESESTSLSVDRVLKWLLDMNRTPEPVFLPTSAAMLFDTLNSAVPHHECIFSDFDYLPDVVVEGENAPIVSTTIDGKARDRATLFAPFGSADIFFPTNFRLLQTMYQRSLMSAGVSMEHESKIKILKASDFFSSNVPNAARVTTKSGYVPLTEDYSNTSFFLTHRSWA
ncbi:hypothetical protein M9434_003467 [Picochlorum sp. BPE23]|nr:hypothetical protein M9434_003467 [Picochlorum sp. BPE23]